MNARDMFRAHLRAARIADSQNMPARAIAHRALAREWRAQIPVTDSDRFFLRAVRQGAELEALAERAERSGRI